MRELKACLRRLSGVPTESIKVHLRKLWGPPAESKATRGITAGSGFATTELKLLLHGLMLALQDDWCQGISIKLFVDDLSLAAIGVPPWVIDKMIRVANFVIHWLEHSLEMTVSDSKSKVVSSLPSVALAIAEGITSKKVKAVERNFSGPTRWGATDAARSHRPHA